jgi:hypothetical protein
MLILENLARGLAGARLDAINVEPKLGTIFNALNMQH